MGYTFWLIRLKYIGYGLAENRLLNIKLYFGALQEFLSQTFTSKNLGFRKNRIARPLCIYVCFKLGTSGVTHCLV